MNVLEALQLTTVHTLYRINSPNGSTFDEMAGHFCENLEAEQRLIDPTLPEHPYTVEPVMDDCVAVVSGLTLVTFKHMQNSNLIEIATHRRVDWWNSQLEPHTPDEETILAALDPEVFSQPVTGPV